MDMPSKLRKAIGAVKDQTSIRLAKVSSNNAANLEVTILKATTHEETPIEDKYVNELLQLVASDKAYAASCAQAIGKRIGKTHNWIVALKCLMLIFRIFQDGDPYFPKEIYLAMKRGAKILNLSTFRDDSNSNPWDYTVYVRIFALYLDERLHCSLSGKLHKRFDGHKACKTSSESICDMRPATALDKLSHWQRLLDRAIATKPSGAAKTNRLVLISLYSVMSESSDLYRDISDGLAIILDNFFHLPYQSCLLAFQYCIKATKQFEELIAFYDLCKALGIGRTSEYPSVQKLSEELLDTLREFLKDQASCPENGLAPQRTPPKAKVSRSLSLDSYEESHESSEKLSEKGSECSSAGASMDDPLDTPTADSFTFPSPYLNEATHSSDFISFSRWSPKNGEKDCDKREQEPEQMGKAPIQTSYSAPNFTSFDDWPQKGSGTGGDDKRGQSQEHAVQATKRPLISTPNFANFDGWSQLRGDSGSDKKDRNASELEPMPSASNLDYGGSKEPAIMKTAKQESLQASPCTTTSAYDLYAENSLFKQSPVFQHPSSLANSFDVVVENSPCSRSSQAQHYNPFLDDSDPSASSITGQEVVPFPTSDMFLAKSTIEAPPTFTAQNCNEIVPFENDPFAACLMTTVNDQLRPSGSADQRSLIQEQQLWLHNQNKIIAKHVP